MQNQFQNSIFQFASIMECFLRWLMEIWLKRKLIFFLSWQLLRVFFFFRLKTMHKMMERSGTLFRDPEDVEQATRFLHENGKILSLHKNCIHLHHVFFMGKLFILNFWGEIFVNTLYLELLNSSKCNLVHHVLEILI